jgi:L-threonylcarbamoyladenylate synthase
MIRLRVDPVSPAAELIDRAAAVIRDGGVVALPTDTLYGLAVDPRSESAVARLFAVKGRPLERAVPLVAADVSQIEAAFDRLPEAARRLGERFWPGPLTLLLPLHGESGRVCVSLAGGTRRIGVRVPNHAVTRAVCYAAGGLVTATSANPSGHPATNDADEVALTLGNSIELLLDAGSTPGGAPSTIVDVAEEPPQLVRAGAIPWETIQACLER